MNETLQLVCGRAMTVAPENFPCAWRAGEKIYFCTIFCLETYQADPERFYAAHSRRKNSLFSNQVNPNEPSV